MKTRKLALILFAMTVCLSLCACGQSEAAANVDVLIREIGTVTADSGDAIEAAEKALDALSEEDAEQVTGTDTLTDARKTYDILTVEDAIDAIGTVTLEKSDAIEDARAAYKDASKEVQEAVGNYEKLQAAEETLWGLQAKEVESLIEAIGTVTVDSEKAIKKARKAYDALSVEAQRKVSNKSNLTDAAKQLREAKKAVKDAEIKSILSRMRVDEDRVYDVKIYTPNVMPKYWNERCYVLPWLQVTENGVAMGLTVNYTGDDWVFFKKAIFSVDGDLTTKSFVYSEIHHEARYGDVVEQVEVDIGNSQSDISLLERIANSKETIVRFDGEYIHDFTVPDSDKQAIRDVLALFDAALNDVAVFDTLS